MHARNIQRWLLLGLAVTIGAGALALLTLRDFRTAQALMPLPIQPFGPEQQGGISTTQLVQPIVDTAFTEIIRGERLGQTWVYSSPGFQVAQDGDIPDETVVGGVIAKQDVNCDSTSPADVDVYAKSSGVNDAYDWLEKTTAVTGTPDEFLKSIMPPFPFLLRHEASMDNLWKFGTTATAVSPPERLNTVYSSIPWSPGAGALVATTRQGGSPVFPSAAGYVCVDSPQTTTSTTTVYSNPALKGDANSDSIDDATGLYPRWAAFQSDPDDRKSRQSPPSIASDTGYVERIVQLQCYWLDEDGCWKDEAKTESCDTNGDGYIGPQESMQDYELAQMGGISTVDPDSDCLIDPTLAQPGQAEDITPYPTDTCTALPYSAEPNVITYTKAQDNDCDGLVDGIELAWGSDPLLTDTDSDGASDFVEMFQLTNPNIQDTDGDGYKDAPAATYQNSNTAFDNCPSIANADQANNDGKRRANGTVLPGSWASNPNQDKMGDACDPDDDNDMAVDVAELARVPATDPLNPDSDGDRCLDGVEGYLDKDPLNAFSRCPALTLKAATFFRACRWNEPPNGYGGGTLWDTEYDATEDNIEWDPDGDGILCQTGTSITDPDNDNGKGLGMAPDEISDYVEIRGYGTMAANKDSDGDGCEDWIEIADVNGDRVSSILDLQWVAKRVFNVVGASDSDPIFDLTKDGAMGILDLQLEAKNSSLVKANNCVPYPEG